MTWTTIAEAAADNPVTDGTQVTSSVWNNQVKGNLEHLYSIPRCQVYKSGNQNVSTASSTDIIWQSESYDTASIHSASSDNLTLVRAGLWLVTAWCNFTSNATGTRRGQLRVNDSTVHAEYYVEASSATNTHFTLSTLIYTSTTTDYVTLRVYQDSGITIDFAGGDAVTSRMSVGWLGA